MHWSYKAFFYLLFLSILWLTSASLSSFFLFYLQTAVEQRCIEAFTAVRLFEKSHCLALQNMGFTYLQRRGELVTRCADIAAALGVKPEAGHDAVLLMDRVMSTSLALAPDLLDLLAAACVIIAAKQVDGPASTLSLPVGTDLQAATGLPIAAVEQMEWNVRQVLNQDTAAISTLRCLKLYLERLGGHAMDKPAAAALAGRSFALVDGCLTDMACLNCRPSVIAAAVLYTDRRARGVIPFWPTMLAKVTGYQDMSTPELSVAIKAAQRMVSRSGNHSPKSNESLSPPRSPAQPIYKQGQADNHQNHLQRSISGGSGIVSAPSNVSLASTSVATASVASGSSGSNGVVMPSGHNELNAANQAVLLALEKGGATFSQFPGVLTPSMRSSLGPLGLDSSASASRDSGEGSEGSSSGDGAPPTELDGLRSSCFLSVQE